MTNEKLDEGGVDDEFCQRLFEWCVSSNFVEVPWSTDKAAKAFNVDKKIIYSALSRLAKTHSDKFQIMWKDGALRIAAQEN